MTAPAESPPTHSAIYDPLAGNVSVITGEGTDRRVIHYRVVSGQPWATLALRQWGFKLDGWEQPSSGLGYKSSVYHAVGLRPAAEPPAGATIIRGHHGESVGWLLSEAAADEASRLSFGDPE